MLQLYQQFDDQEIGVLCYSCISSMMMKRSVCYVTVVSAVWWWRDQCVMLQLYQQYDDEEISVLCYSCISSMMMKRSVCYVTVVSAVWWWRDQCVMLQLYQQYDDEEISVLCYSCISSMMMKRSVCCVTVVSAVWWWRDRCVMLQLYQQYDDEEIGVLLQLYQRYDIYNRLPVLQISMFRSSSQDLVAASGQRRPAKPSGALCIMQSTTTCCTDCVMCPQAHVADSWTPQSFNVSPTRAVPQRRRFSFTHCLRWRICPRR